MNLEKLCLDLATTEDGDEVKNILENYSIWNNDDFWMNVGSIDEDDKELNNAAIIGSQQSNSANALVEKLVNCGDSALLLRCQEEGIELQGNSSPQNTKDAMERLLDLSDGRWINATPTEGTALAKKYCNIVATGEKGRNTNPTYTIIDNCEGQDPVDFKKTFMSLTRKNKMKIRFVQGKFGMGSFGAVNFCTKYGLQLIISKRHPHLIAPNHKNEWGFTVVRKIKPTRDERCSKWQYLVVEKEIASFKKDDLKIFPGKYPNPYGESFQFGSFIKLYNYDIGPSLRSNITLDFYNAISSLIVNPVVPVRLHERRDGYSANSAESTLYGLETRLLSDREGVIAKGFPSDFMFNVENQQFVGKIYAFNKYSDPEKKKKIKTKDYANGVIFTINGQSNGNLQPRFFSQKGLKFENISNHLLVIIDCSKVDSGYIEDIFQNNRERIYTNRLTDKIKEQIASVLVNHSGIRKFQNEWRSNQVKEIKDNKKTKELFEKFISKNRNLSSYFNLGPRFQSPFNKKEGDEFEYKGLQFPTFFKTKKTYSSTSPRAAERGRNVRIILETNAQNDYFTRAQDCGNFKIFKFDKDITNSDGVQLSGFDGNWTLSLPESEEELQKYRFEVMDVSRIEPLICEFFLKLEDFKPRDQKKSKKKDKSNQLDYPEIYPLKKKDFEDHKITEKDLLYVDETMDKNYIYLNEDNIYVNSYIKALKDRDIDLAKEQYQLSAMMLGMNLLNQYKEKYSKENSDENKPSLKEYSLDLSQALAPIYMDFIRDISNIAED